MSRYAAALPVDFDDDDLDQYGKDEFPDDENCFKALKYKKPPIGKGAGLDGNDFDSRLDEEGQKVFDDIYGDCSGKFKENLAINKEELSYF